MIGLRSDTLETLLRGSFHLLWCLRSYSAAELSDLTVGLSLSGYTWEISSLVYQPAERRYLPLEQGHGALCPCSPLNTGQCRISNRKKLRIQ